MGGLSTGCDADDVISLLLTDQGKKRLHHPCEIDHAEPGIRSSCQKLHPNKRSGDDEFGQERRKEALNNNAGRHVGNKAVVAISIGI